MTQNSELASLPEVVVRVIGMAEDPGTTASQFAAVITRDPNLTGRLLRLANSSYFSRSGSIDTIQRAVAVIGVRQVRDLAVGLAAVRAFQGIPVTVMSMDDFWAHSLYTALIARRLGAVLNRDLADTVFVGGLLHDVGQLLILLRHPEEARKALWMITEGPDDLTLDAAERDVLGFDHAQAGQELAAHWKLPASLRECVAFHHTPDRATAAHAPAVAVVHAANSLAYLAETDSTDLEAGPPIAPSAARLIGLRSLDLQALVAEAREEMAETRSLFGL